MISSNGTYGQRRQMFVPGHNFRVARHTRTNPILRRSMRIQHYVHVMIPETILAGGRRSRSGLVRRAPIER
jgi:hypothetical protein